jgi:two-component system NtrC family sensor kinase
MKISLRTKLIASSLAVIVICGLAATLVGIHLIGDGIISQAQDKVRTDLNSARHLYQDRIEKIKESMRLTALRFFIKEALIRNDVERLKGELEMIRRRESLDILILTDKNGQVIVRSRNPSVHGDNQAHDPLVSQILSGKEVIAGTVIIPKEELLKEGADLAEQALVKFIPTPKAKTAIETEETSAMMIKAAVPVLANDGSLIGVLYGGKSINKNYEIVDEVKETVYQGVKYKDKEIGIATIFQGDVRISTNVERGNGSRAIGTRVSEEVYDQVLVKGLPWIHRAFVVNDWYIAAYEPIKSIDGKIIGILCVGLLEEKFVDMRNRAILMFLGITLAGMIIALAASLFLAKRVLKPIRLLVLASKQLAKGNLEYEVKVESKDEIGELGKTFNLMASSLKARDEQLKEHTQQQIMKSERLATLGQLAAGVAHEINNPLGAVLMYTHLALEDLDGKDVLRKNLEKTVTETSRCKDIVKGLLDFARQTEPKVEESDVNKTVERTLAVIEKQALFQNVKLSKVICPSLPKVLMDASQIQQVFTNIVLNAAEAMQGKGELTVTTNHEIIFDPFFTTKEVGHGTGLGLAVSHGIIARHNGSIEVKSKLGKGTSFIIRLPLKQKGGLSVQAG